MEMIQKSKTVFMKSIPITTVEMNTRLAEGMIEYHINNMHHAEKSLSKEMIWENFENMSWCCEHSPVEGTIEMSFFHIPESDIKHVSIPVHTYFGVVCT